MTFARRFAQCSYNTVACGKLHHTGIDQMQGWTTRIGGDLHIDDRFIEGKESEYFEKIEKNPDYSKWFEVKEVLRAGVGRGPQFLADEYTVQGAVDFVEKFFLSPYYDKVRTERPLLLKVSIHQPHYPYFTTEELSII